MRRVKNPMPTVAYEGNEYKLKSRNTEIPNFEQMERLSVLIWLNQNTTPRGFTRKEDVRIGGVELIN